MVCGLTASCAQTSDATLVPSAPPKDTTVGASEAPKLVPLSVSISLPAVLSRKTAEVAPVELAMLTSVGRL